MCFKKIVLAIAIVAVSKGALAENDLAQEIQALKEKLELLEQKSKQQEQQLMQINIVTASPQSVKKSNFEIEPYGFIRADMAEHFRGSDKIFNKINTVPLDSSGNNINGRTLFTVNASRLGLDVKTHLAEQDIIGKIEIDFRGGNEQDQLRIRHAYIKAGNWLFGQTTSPFVSADILPEMVDFMANVGGGVQRNPMIQYQHNFDKNLKTLIALEDGSKGLDDQTRFPALTTKTQFKFNENKVLLNLRTLVLQKKTTEDSALAWGVGLGGIYQINEYNKLHADYYHVKGDSKFMLFANDGYVLNKDKQIIENQYDSLSLALTHQWDAKWKSTLGFGGMIANNQGEYAQLSPTANRSLYQGWLNLLYAPNKPLLYAIEYVYGERKNFINQRGTDSRLEFMVKYSF